MKDISTSRASETPRVRRARARITKASRAPGKTYANHTAMHLVMDLADWLVVKGLGPYEFIVLLVIAKHINQKTQDCWLSYKTIADEAAMARSTAIEAVKNLVAAKLLLKFDPDQHERECNIYRLVPVKDYLGSDKDQAGIRHAPAQSPSHTAQVSASDQPGLQDGPEVVTEVEITGKGSKSMNQSAGLKPGNQGVMDGFPSSNHPVPSEAKTSLTQGTPAAPPAAASASARLLAERYFELMGKRKKDADAYVSHWPGIFEGLLQEYSQQDLLAMMEWAVLTDKFWPKKLLYSNDRAQYFAEHFTSIENAWLRATHDQRNRPNNHQAETKSSGISYLFKGSVI